MVVKRVERPRKTVGRGIRKPGPDHQHLVNSRIKYGANYPYKSRRTLLFLQSRRTVIHASMLEPTQFRSEGFRSFFEHSTIYNTTSGINAPERRVTKAFPFLARQRKNTLHVYLSMISSLETKSLRLWNHC